jgi:hypothetical protein
MKNYYYYKTFRKTIIQFLELFNDIKIGRYNESGTLLKTVTVPIRFSPKSKAYLYVKENSRNEEMLPMISIDLQSIDFDPNRLGNRHESVLVTKGNASTAVTQYYKNAVPYNLTFNLRIWTLNMVDVDQIYEQILPYFAPYVFMRVNIPEVDTTVEVKVVLQSCSPEMSEDASEEEARVIRWSTIFVANTWLFKPITDVKIVEQLFINYYTEDSEFADRSTTSTFTSGASGSSVESQAFTGLGIDSDAKIIYDYERFGNN